MVDQLLKLSLESRFWVVPLLALPWLSSAGG